MVNLDEPLIFTSPETGYADEWINGEWKSGGGGAAEKPGFTWKMTSKTPCVYVSAGIILNVILHKSFA